ncbi:hypothetical protein ER308_13835 [Egibacter rhizosphaerae]|uniref:Uncharacterized protein n=1 Tax=Egibacter rhizosphaerae TaxID=1670831 RepID=A0A411YH47_9ACTN|nr:hypothetical protein [Egibacter rhizosphaerae]QBI20537.1 hypothetical protein ER308_13835 [Egibacter rhizosphaerae]
MSTGAGKVQTRWCATTRRRGIDSTQQTRRPKLLGALGGAARTDRVVLHDHRGLVTRHSATTAGATRYTTASYAKRRNLIRHITNM